MRVPNAEEYQRAVKSFLDHCRNSTPEHATAVGEAVVRLLEVQDAEGFAGALAVTHPHNRKQVVDSAQLVLDQAARSGLAPSRVHFHVKEALAKATGMGEDPRCMTSAKAWEALAKALGMGEDPQGGAKGEMLPTSFGIRIILLGEPAGDSEADKPLRGEYELALGGSFEFPDGWRTYEGVRWSRFPDGIADERTKREVLLISSLVALSGAALHAAADPALAELGHALIRFLQQRDENIFANEAMPCFDECREKLLKELNAAGVKPLPSREEVQGAWNMMRGQLVESAQGVLAQAEALGLDFSGAEITLKDASADYPYMRGGYGSVDGITAGPLRFTLNVKSGQKSKAGPSMEGDYILATPRGQRGPIRWAIEDKIRWEKFPDGLVGEKGLADMAFENYVAEHGALPPGTSVPDVELVRLDNGSKVKLSDFRGQVVVLEWWHSSCGPCQKPMAALQTLQGQHPEWKDRVAIITLSINNDLREAQDHLVQHGWTNTLNLWAGPGGWMSTPFRQFRLHGVPTCYVIDPQGKVVPAADPMSPCLANLIAGLLR
jgi:thiol-disulfide isomerase/thioredoxin